VRSYRSSFSFNMCAAAGGMVISLNKFKLHALWLSAKRKGMDI